MSKVSLRRAVAAVQRCGVARVRTGLEKQHDAQAACEPGGGGCGGVPDHPPRTTHPPYVPRPSALDHLDRDMLQRLTCSRTATVVCVVSDVHYSIVED